MAHSSCKEPSAGEYCVPRMGEAYGASGSIIVRSLSMGNYKGSFPVPLLLCFFLLPMLYSATAQQQVTPPIVPSLAGLSQNSSLQARYIPLFGEPGDIDSSLDNGSTLRLRLESHSGSGVRSQDPIFRGFFNAAIKLPGGNSAGIVSAFYASNADYYPYSHDEIDMEFLGVLPGQPYVMQTNIYGDGSTDIGREERFHLWFDPTADFHNYSILWTYHHIVFFVDNIPVRRYMYSAAPGIQYPSKPMSAYATIWDGSNWATDGGQYPVDYTQGPHDVTFTNLKLEGCVWNPAVQPIPPECAMPDYTAWFNDIAIQDMSDEQMIALDWARTNFMWYSYCKDRQRYPLQPPAECLRGDVNGTVNGKKQTSGSREQPLHRMKPKTVGKRNPRPRKQHKKKNRIKSKDIKAFHYLPHSLWGSEVPVKSYKKRIKIDSIH